jgi:hypothetical protein
MNHDMRQLTRQPLLPLILNGMPPINTHHGYSPYVGFQYPAQNFRFPENMANQICNHHVAPPAPPNMEIGSGRRIIIRLTQGEQTVLLEAAPGLWFLVYGQTTL